MNSLQNVISRNGTSIINLKSLLAIFSNEVLIDFKDYISERYNVPSALWTVDAANKIVKLGSNNQMNYYPHFCEYLLTNESSSDTHFCMEKDKETNIYNAYIRNNAHFDFSWDVVKCPLGIKRIVFPIKVEDKLMGILVVGKFISNTEDKLIIHEKVDTLCGGLEFKSRCKTSKEIEEFSIKLSYEIDNITILSEQQVKNLASDILKITPLLERYCKHIQPNDAIHDGLIFLESLEKETENVFLTYDKLWTHVGNILEKIVIFFKLKYAGVYFSGRDDYTELFLRSSYPPSPATIKQLSMSSRFELQSLLQEKSWTISTEDKGWIHEHSDEIFASNKGILQAEYVFAGKVVVLAIGLEQDYRVNQCNELIFKIAIQKLFKYLSKVLTNVELDHMMAETGHMLDRSAGAVKSGYDVLKRFGFYEGKEDSDYIKQKRLYAKNSIELGLLKLDLIIRNYHSYKKSKEIITACGMAAKPASVDILEILNNYENAYLTEMQKEEKHFKYKIETSSTLIPGPKDVIDLIIFNLIDNAIKFAYNGTFIEIQLKQVGEYLHLSISNLGIGIAKDEREAVFERYYQSKFKDPKKRREGTGTGLATCKRFISYYYPDGSIKIDSSEAYTKHKRKFDGDNYITTVTIAIKNY